MVNGDDEDDVDDDMFGYFPRLCINFISAFPHSLHVFPSFLSFLCQIFFQSVHLGVFGKGSNVAIFSANHRWPLQLLYYRTTVMI